MAPKGLSLLVQYYKKENIKDLMKVKVPSIFS